MLDSRKHFARKIAALGLLALAAPSLEAALIHRYELDGTYADALGGPTLVPGGSGGAGTLNATDYSFNPNQGLSVASALPSNTTYSILSEGRGFPGSHER